MNTRSAIDAVLGAEKIAIAGVSRKDAKFGSMVFKELAEGGKKVVGINPNMESYMDRPCFPDIEHLPADVEALITVVKPEQTLKLLQSAEQRGIRKVWMQQGSESPEAIAFCKEHKFDFVSKECVFMYSDPVKSIHRFHRGINKVFGKYLKG